MIRPLQWQSAHRTSADIQTAKAQVLRHQQVWVRRHTLAQIWNNTFGWNLQTCNSGTEPHCIQPRPRSQGSTHMCRTWNLSLKRFFFQLTWYIGHSTGQCLQWSKWQGKREESKRRKSFSSCFDWLKKHKYTRWRCKRGKNNSHPGWLLEITELLFVSLVIFYLTLAVVLILLSQSTPPKYVPLNFIDWT